MPRENAIALSLSSQSHGGGNPEKETDEILSSEVVAVLNELGHYNRVTNVYQLNPSDHGPCLRDLIRFLRNDGPTFLVRRQLGLSNVVANDLLPIVEQHTIQGLVVTPEGKSIMDKVIRLLVDLTNPTVLHFRDQKIPKDDKYQMQIYMELQNYLYNFKLSFASHKRFWIIVTKFITHIVDMDDDSRQVEDGLLLERIIVLIRNVLHIPVISTSIDLEDDTSVQDRLIELFHKYELLNILQYLISSDDHQEYCFHLIEILNLLLREQNAEFLAQSTESDRAHNPADGASLLSSSRSQYEKDCDSKDFNELRSREQQTLANSVLKQKAQDFTRFTGSAFVIKNMKSISDRDMVIHKAYLDPTVAIDLNRDKMVQRKARNRKPMEENVGGSDATGVLRIHRSNRHIRSILYDFCAQFLSESYNQFMALVKDNLSRGAAQDNDQTYYLWAIQFFMEFSRNRKLASPEDKYKQVYQTLSTGTFHYLQTLVDDYLEHLQMKKEFKHELGNWSKRLHCALRAYRELLLSIEALDKMNLPEASMMCYRIKKDLFTEPEYRELLLRLLQGYNEERMSKAYLRDLIETNHVFLKMLEYHAKISYDFKVKVKKKNRKKREKKDDQDKDDQPQQSLEEIWLEISDQVLEELKSKTIMDEVDVQADDEFVKLLYQSSSQELESQKLDIVRAVGKLLKTKDVKKAVVLYREARNSLMGLDPDNTFGEMNIQPEEELESLNQILLADIPEEKKKKKPSDEDEQDEDEGENEYADQVVRNHRMEETKFSIEDTVRRYATPSVIKAYRFLLQNYQSNASHTNHAIARMLYRIGVTMKMTPMFFNLGYFVIFQNILEDANLKRDSSFKELGAFAFFVISKFFKLLRKFPKLVCEICFLPNAREAYEMEVGFVQEDVARIKTQAKKGAWSDEHNYELEVLYKDYKHKANAEKDVVDLIQEHMIDDTRTRRQIINQLKKLDLIQASDIKTNSSKGPKWSDEELKELVELYQRYKDNVQSAQLTTTIEVSTDEIPSSQTQVEDEIVAEQESKSAPIQSSKRSSHRFDIIDAILLRLSTKDQRSRRQVIRQLKMIGLYDHRAKSKWTQDQIEKLESIFNQVHQDFQCFKDNQHAQDDDNKENNESGGHFDFTKEMMNKLEDFNKSIGQIIRQLKKMGFEDKLKQVGLYKGSKKREADIDTDGSSDEEDADDLHRDDDVVVQFDDDQNDSEPSEILSNSIELHNSAEMEELRAKKKAAKERLMLIASQKKNIVSPEKDGDDSFDHHDSSDVLASKNRSKNRVHKLILSDSEDDEPEDTNIEESSIQKERRKVFDSDEEADGDNQDSLESNGLKMHSEEDYHSDASANANRSKAKARKLVLSDSEDDEPEGTNIEESSIQKRKVIDSGEEDNEDSNFNTSVKRKRIILSDDED